ncbi:MAG: TetR/AcrR family transcriptional regulator [Gemmatimonadetes bacterium]|nr:TetR/AcrR family transcriptional regulator [Gemmatimonadota bacterium]MCA9763043.1 TetR/AcrR family transcriptional regulator [Gemmatimonadota bacterium]MCB9504684.1 TetR/AcrR family transcriptional regulator [Gemmatimonadales bacterium]HPF61054.1 TetR/AcrR family transcriptional regulator [Gemmatimonadales bacterium]HRX17866.1 TetR/AcrR family transcriptional regulator [Gemmatimonadales bacterium]
MAEAAQTTRDRLLDAARELFTTAGYHATTTPILAGRAGVAEGTIYRHFPSKHALLNAAYQDVQAWGLALVETQLTGLGQAAERLAILGRSWLDLAERDPARMRMLLGWRLPGELDEASVLAARAFHQGIEQLLAVGKQEGSVRAGVVELWATVWLALVGLAVERITAREWTPRHPHALATLEAAWEAIAWRPIALAPTEPPADDARPTGTD